ncbi:MAG: GNAT family N-acetyltransferase [Rhodobacteraceae bacterium]|nr:GNAT family N-acetyltransferase [Paracoccaceae bacterium]
MTAALTLAGPDHADALLPLIASFHEEAGFDLSDDHRANALQPLLDGVPHGVAYLIGPARAPIGYAIISFGWSMELGGMDGFLDELYIRPGVRGRGIATEVLRSLPKALASAGMKAMHLEVDTQNDKARALYERCGFRMRDGYHLMTRVL